MVTVLDMALPFFYHISYLLSLIKIYVVIKWRICLSGTGIDVAFVIIFKIFNIISL